MKIRFSALLCVCLLTFSAMAQRESEGGKPFWLSGDYPRTHNTTFRFERAEGIGSTFEEARHEAVFTLISNLFTQQGVEVSGQEVNQMIAQSDTKNYNERTSFSATYTLNGRPIEVRFQVADTYWRKFSKGYQVVLLFEVANDPKRVRFETIYFTQSYGGKAFVRSLLPGGGQFYKKQTGKGIFFLTGVGLTLGAAVVAHVQGGNYWNKAQQSTDMMQRNAYLNRSLNWDNIRNGLSIGAGVLYLWNLIDAATSQGVKRQTFRPSQHSSLNILPVVSPQGVEIGFTQNF